MQETAQDKLFPQVAGKDEPNRKQSLCVYSCVDLMLLFQKTNTDK